MQIIDLVARKLKNGTNWVLAIIKFKLQVFLEKNKVSKNNNYVLMFHQILNSDEKESMDEYSISGESFIDMIETISNNGYMFVSPYTIADRKCKNSILVTFDDAYKGVHDKVFAYLKENDIPFVIFQSLSLLDKNNYLSSDDICEMLSYDNAYIGYHTFSHKQMIELDDKQFEYEVVKSCEQFEELIKRKIDLFAYPYGAFVTLKMKDAFKLRKKYKLAFSTLQRGVDHYYFKICKYFIPRLNVNENNYRDVLELITKKY